jgi:predicted nucleotide-binding protein
VPFSQRDHFPLLHIQFRRIAQVVFVGEAAKRAQVRNFGTIIDGEEVERAQPPPTTFVIHGHDHAGVTELKDVMKRLKLPEPVVMKDQLIAGATLPEKFEQLAGPAMLAIALLTPDDLGSTVPNQFS